MPDEVTDPGQPEITGPVHVPTMTSLWHRPMTPGTAILLILLGGGGTGLAGGGLSNLFGGDKEHDECRARIVDLERQIDRITAVVDETYRIVDSAHPRSIGP